MKGKRNIKVVDESGMEIEVHIWAPAAHKFDNLEGENPVVAFKSARIVEFQGKALTMGEESHFEFNPIDVRTQQLREWFSSFDRNSLKSVNSGITSEKDINKL